VLKTFVVPRLGEFWPRVWSAPTAWLLENRRLALRYNRCGFIAAYSRVHACFWLPKASLRISGNCLSS